MAGTLPIEDLGLIGNCQIAALVARDGTIPWLCLPRFDSDPVFATLLDSEAGGSFGVTPAAGEKGTQAYLPNTNVIETTFRTADGSFRVIDFAPRFFHHDRPYRPVQIMRIVEPLEGTPRIRVWCDPVLGWSKEKPARRFGSTHIRYLGFPSPLRLTTDIPLAYMDGRSFSLTGRRHLVLSWGRPVNAPLASLCSRSLGDTVRYWQKWVKHCNMPSLFQQEVIRSALTLKLHCYEDTGAIVAAMTTSIPESPDASGRTWDYRYCWLRDAYYVLAALRRLGHFEERERFVEYLLDIAGANPSLELAPLYRVDGSADLEERILPNWPGYEGHGPVRVGNGAVTQRQHDIYGEMVLALAPVFLDQRFRQEQTQHTLQLLRRLSDRAIAVAGTPDAGIWEHRTAPRPQTFSSLMCWAAADRMATVASRHLPETAGYYTQAASRIREELLARAWNPNVGSLVATFGGADLDAALLQASSLRLLPENDPRLHGTIDTLRRELSTGDWMFRYRDDDGFGRPTVGFMICTFWLVEALAMAGRAEEAREVLERARASMSPLGLLSEDYEVATGRMWGNFPQAYSHVGFIHAAFSASPRWSEL
ncbi:MAG: glycoside hydrolase family 15 protein [Pseudomonadota bacterium]|nr:glycoside hydrolase family 15 protein [Pseudomonadota bacterium]